MPLTPTVYRWQPQPDPWLLAFLGEGGSNFPERDAEIISRMVKDRISV